MLKRNNSYVLIVTSEMGSENLLRDLVVLSILKISMPMLKTLKEY